MVEIPRVTQFHVVNGSSLSFVTEISIIVMIDVDKALSIVSQNSRVANFVPGLIVFAETIVMMIKDREAATAGAMNQLMMI